jgi:hypothetical protein
MTPYVSATVHPMGEEKRTLCVNSVSFDETWVWTPDHNGIIKLPVDEESKSVSLELWNENFLDDDFIGNVEVDLRRINFEQGVVKTTYNVDTGGKLSVSLSWKPLMKGSDRRKSSPRKQATVNTMKLIIEVKRARGLKVHLVLDRFRYVHSSHDFLACRTCR